MPISMKKMAERDVLGRRFSQVPGDAVLSLAAPAKINLFLHVTGRRDDGYHFLESLVVFTEIGDRLVVEAAKGLKLSIVGVFAEELQGSSLDNLVLRGAAALQREGSVEIGAHITLEKNLPVSSGVGGGSADAAAALRGLAVLWGVDMTPSRMVDIGLAIGADVPVCLNARPAIMSGVGETIRSVAPPPSCGVVLVNAGEGVSTPEVFAARTAPFSSAGDWQTPRTFNGLIEALTHRKNDLSDPALSVSPVIRDTLAAVSGTGHCALARLSGSGGTCFGLYPDAAAAAEAAAAIKAVNPNWWCVATAFRDEVPTITSC